MMMSYVQSLLFSFLLFRCVLIQVLSSLLTFWFILLQGLNCIRDNNTRPCICLWLDRSLYFLTLPAFPLSINNPSVGLANQILQEILGFYLWLLFLVHFCCWISCISRRYLLLLSWLLLWLGLRRNLLITLWWDCLMLSFSRRLGNFILWKLVNLSSCPLISPLWIFV